MAKLADKKKSVRVLEAKRSAVLEVVIAGSSINTGIKAAGPGCLRHEVRVRGCC